ncbi:MAG TPA: sigma-54 dependent transcriptional regulator [Vicinamibacterales bacterium]
MDRPFYSLVGSSAAMTALRQQTAAAARSEAKVLITGESGSGKEVVAHLLHQGSRRGCRRMAVLNCAGVPETLLETELFGHTRGGFTGAFRDRPGLFESAHGGTAFLDEVGEMSPRMQGVLLRFLETGELQRVGSTRPNMRVDVRVVAATNRVLSDRVASGHFRLDLFYRLNVIHLEVPPLRDRLEDVPALLAQFIRRYSEEYRLAAPVIEPGALAALMRHDWPGNVRELKNLAERLVVRSSGGTVCGQEVRSWLATLSEAPRLRPASGL